VLHGPASGLRLTSDPMIELGISFADDLKYRASRPAGCHSKVGFSVFSQKLPFLEDGRRGNNECTIPKRRYLLS
jgi:hypothetical protein